MRRRNIPALFIPLLLGACMRAPLGPVVQAGPSSFPAPIPTMQATAVPGEYPNDPMTVLGTVPCSGLTPGASVFILRNAAQWAAYSAKASCDVPVGAISLSGFNFAAQSVLILQYVNCGTFSYNSVNIWNVYKLSGYLYARCDISTNPPNPVQADCVAEAVAIPATTEGVTWTVCEQAPGYHCLDFVTP